jgi:hypothetical protein
MVLAIDLHKYFVDVKCITISAMPSFQPPGIYCSEFDTPEANGFTADSNSAFRQEVFDVSMAQIEPIVEPDGVG